MAWTTPKTWVALDPLTASELNTHVRDNLTYLKAIADAQTFSGSQASRGTAQSLATGVAEYISLTTQNYDYGGWFAPTSTKIIVPAGAIPSGYTLIAVMAVGTIEFEASSGVGSRSVRVKKNGSNFAYQTIGAITDQQPLTVTDFTTAAAADEFQLEGLHSEGHGLDVVYASLTIVRFALVS